MKHLFFIGCAMTILISISCKKDSVDAAKNYCSHCGIDTPAAAHWQAIYITDSNWTRQGQHVFKSDLTELIIRAGASVSEVYALQLQNEGAVFEFFPCCQVSVHGGELSGSIDTTGNEETCTLTFSYSEHDAYSGQIPDPGMAPFQSIVVKVWLWK
jgi:hypothetical protein